MSLPDYLRPGLDLLFVGFNPSLKSAELGHYYAGPGNQFWSFLFEADLTDRKLAPDEDHLLLDYGIGLTDLVKRPTRGSGDLSTRDLRSGLPLVQQKVSRYRPAVVCFNGKIGYARAIGRTCEYGLQEERLEGKPLFLAPSSSGALPMLRADKLSYYQKLKRLVDRTAAS